MKKTRYSSDSGWELESIVDDACMDAYNEGWDDGYQTAKTLADTDTKLDEDGVELVCRTVEYKGEKHQVWIRW